MKSNPCARDPGTGLHWLLDYHECCDEAELTTILNEITQREFRLELVIPKLGGTFVVLFRRNDLG